MGKRRDRPRVQPRDGKCELAPGSQFHKSESQHCLDEMAIPRRKAIKNRSVGGEGGEEGAAAGENGEHNNFMAQ